MRLLPLVLLFCAACSNSVDPFADGGPPFAVYGYLDTERDTQVVRIEPVQPRAPFDTSQITVVLQDESAATSEVLRADIVPLEDGTEALLYRVTQPVQVGHAYALRVAAASGEATTARAMVPALRQAAIGWTSADTLLWLRGPQEAPAEVVLIYTVALRGDSASVPVPYRVGEKWNEGFAYRLQLRRDRQVMLSAVRGAASDTLELLALSVEMQDNGPEWRDETARNIENGYGFFSTISRSIQLLFVPEAVERRIESGL